MSNQPITPTIVEIDCLTGIIAERLATPEELSQQQENAISLAKQQTIREEAKATQAASLASAQAKLTSLGLTAEEVAAITGQPVTTPTS